MKYVKCTFAYHETFTVIAKNYREAWKALCERLRVTYPSHGSFDPTLLNVEVATNADFGHPESSTRIYLRSES